MPNRAESCPCRGGSEPVAIAKINGTEYALCRECVRTFVAAHAELAKRNRPAPRKK
jgi:hypothetical protein